MFGKELDKHQENLSEKYVLSVQERGFYKEQMTVNN